MKNLSVQEVESVSGGWDWEFDVGFFKVSGDGSEFVAAYDWAVDQTADFFTWWDPMGYYDHC